MQLLELCLHYNSDVIQFGLHISDLLVNLLVELRLVTLRMYLNNQVLHTLYFVVEPLDFLVCQLVNWPWYLIYFLFQLY